MSIRLSCITALLLTLGGLCAAGDARVADTAAVVPSPPHDANPAFDLQSFVDAAIARGESTIYLPRGRHQVRPIRGVHLRLRGLKDVAIVADGVEIVCTQTTRAVELQGCQGLTLSGLSIDYDPLPYTQGRIVKLSDDKRVHEIEVAEGYPLASAASTKKYQVFRRDDHSLRGVDYFDPKVEVLGPRRLRVTKTQRGPKPEEVGDLICIGSGTDEEPTLPHAVTLESCSGVRLERVTVYASNCFAFLERDCDRSVYDGCRVGKRSVADDPVSRSMPRLRSANADGFHSKLARVGPQIVGCYAHYQGDDCVNINGDYHLVSHATGSVLRVIAKQEMDIRAGDRVELTGLSGSVLPVSRVVSVRRGGSVTAADRSVVASLKLHADLQSHSAGRLGDVYEVELDRAANPEPGSLIAAVNRRGDGFTVAECDFGHVRSRGIIIKASNGDVRDNRLTQCRGESVKIAGEPFWLESGSASNVRVLRNTISDCGSVAIAVYARGAAGGFASGTAHREITILDNRIWRSPRPNVFVSSTDSVRLEGNESHDGGGASPRDHSLLRAIASLEPGLPTPILLHHCSDVLMRSNATH